MNKLKVNDIMTIGALSALYFICVGIGTLLGIPFDKSGNMFYAPAFAALLSGTVYLLMIAKVKKFGAITILGTIMGIFFFLTGHFFAAVLPAIIFGLIADCIAFLGKYQSKWINLFSFIVFSFANSGPIILMWILKDIYIQSLLDKGKDMSYVNKVMLDFNLSTISWFIFTVVLGALLGGLFGNSLLKKHFLKSGMIS